MQRVLITKGGGMVGMWTRIGGAHVLESKSSSKFVSFLCMSQSKSKSQCTRFQVKSRIPWNSGFSRSRKLVNSITHSWEEMDDGLVVRNNDDVKSCPDTGFVQIEITQLSNSDGIEKGKWRWQSIMNDSRRRWDRRVEKLTAAICPASIPLSDWHDMKIIAEDILSMRAALISFQPRCFNMKK